MLAVLRDKDGILIGSRRSILLFGEAIGAGPRRDVRCSVPGHGDRPGSGDALDAVRLAYVDERLDLLLGPAHFHHNELLADINDFAFEHLDQR